jgi:hypothetical protein
VEFEKRKLEADDDSKLGTGGLVQKTAAASTEPNKRVRE